LSKTKLNVSPISGDPGNDENSSHTPSSNQNFKRGNSLQEENSSFLHPQKEIFKQNSGQNFSPFGFNSSKEMLNRYKMNSKSGMIGIPKAKTRNFNVLAKNKSQILEENTHENDQLPYFYNPNKQQALKKMQKKCFTSQFENVFKSIMVADKPKKLTASPFFKKVNLL
jgi:hypothetical protein